MMISNKTVSNHKKRILLESVIRDAVSQQLVHPEPNMLLNKHIKMMKQTMMRIPTMISSINQAGIWQYCNQCHIALYNILLTNF